MTIPFAAEHMAAKISRLRSEVETLNAKLGEQQSVPDGLLDWAVDRWHAEVSQRPLINIHRRTLDETWRQIIRKLGGDPVDLCGPAHADLLAAAPSAPAAQGVSDGLRAECFAEDESAMPPHSCAVVAGIASAALSAFRGEGGE